MTDKITSIAELKKAMKHAWDWADTKNGYAIYAESLRVIDEFEAGLKDELRNTVDWLHSTNSVQRKEEARAVINELGIILSYSKEEIERLLFSDDGGELHRILSKQGLADGGILKILHGHKLTRIWFKGHCLTTDEIKLDGEITELDFKEISEGDKCQLQMNIPDILKRAEGRVRARIKKRLKEIEELERNLFVNDPDYFYPDHKTEYKALKRMLSSESEEDRTVITGFACTLCDEKFEDEGEFGEHVIDKHRGDAIQEIVNNLAEKLSGRGR